jgi:hypothetical protein
MAYTKTAGIATTGLTASTTLATHIAGIEAAAVAGRNKSNHGEVERLLTALTVVADLVRVLHL